jgi:hypothetical protein
LKANTFVVPREAARIRAPHACGSAAGAAMLAKAESISAIVANCDSIAGTRPERSSSSSAEAGSMSCSVSSSLTWVSNLRHKVGA